MANIFKLFSKAANKLIIGPLKYKQKDGYNSEQYWADRFKKHGDSIKAVGHEGWSEEENLKDYKEAIEQVRNLVNKHHPLPPDANVLEIGVGQGYYTGLMKDMAVSNYTGIDITDFYFADLQQRFPGYKFLKRNAGVDKIDGKFDLIIMIDVIQHIVNEDYVKALMRNIEEILVDGGTFIISGLYDKDQQVLYYVHKRSVKSIEACFTRMTSKEHGEFRGINYSVFKKNQA